jgi:FtsP/CotA-like multicopper oxidase with cupredoxin domain
VLVHGNLQTRRQFLTMAGVGAASLLASPVVATTAPEYSIEIAPYTLEASARHKIKTTAYNAQIPGPLLRFKEGQLVSIDVTNHTAFPEVLHWHGLFLPPQVDGAMEEGTPMIPAGAKVRYTFMPRPAGFRWYHTHTFAGRDLSKGQYSGQHGFLLIEPRENPARYDQEFFLALHDWNGHLQGTDDGAMEPMYDVSTINGRVLGFGEPLKAKEGQRVLLHIVNSSATEPHWIALAGHQFQVIALDGNPVSPTAAVPMLRLAPAERVSAVVEMNNPGQWILGEVRKHVQVAGMGIVVEYANRSGEPRWQQPEALVWDYARFGAPAAAPANALAAIEIPLAFKSKFKGHGNLERWLINGKSFPNTETIMLHQGQRYRLLLKNESDDDHPVHLHRHIFELRSIAGREMHGVFKDTVLVDAHTQTDVEFTADHPGMTLFHCHQQDHMDLGFMMLFRYA